LETTVCERIEREGKESWPGAPVVLPQLPLETALSPMALLDEFREKAMLV
jgi:hypothetical protein